MKRKKVIKHFINKEVFEELDKEYEEIISMLSSVEKKADQFC